MATPTPAQAAEKWGRRLKAAQPDIQRGVEAVTVAPTEQAANAQDKMLAKLTEAVTSGKWAKGLRRVTLQDWRDATIKKGIPRLAAGVDAGAPKMEAFMTEFLPHAERVSAEVAAMPDLTLEDSIARSNHAIRRLAEFQRS